MSVRPPSAVPRPVATKEFNTTEDLLHLKNWIAKQPHLNGRTDDQWLSAFLRGCKYQLQKAKDKIDTYYTMRTLLPEYYGNRDPFSPDLQEFLQQGFLFPLPKIPSTGCRTVFFVAKRLNNKFLTPQMVTRGILATVDTLMVEEDSFTSAGTHVFVDLQNISYSYILSVTPTMIKQWVMLYLKAYPVSIKSMHIINIPSFTRPLLQLLMSLVSRKFKERMHFQVGAEIDYLYEYIPPSVLPKEYGGQAGSLDELAAQTKQMVESNRDWFIKDMQYGSDETKRLGEPITSEELFGVEGSFRKLEVD